MTWTKVIGTFLVFGGALGINWTTAPLQALILSGLVLFTGVGVIVWAEWYERAHPDLFLKKDEREAEDGK